MTLGRVVAVYRATFTAGAKGKNTALTERIHLAHAERVLGGQTPMAHVTAVTLQEYIESRSAVTFRGRPIKPQTVKKELATLRYVWNWAFRNAHVGLRFPGAELVFPKAKLKEPFRTLDQIATAVARGGLAAAQVPGLWDALDLNPAEIGEVLDHVRRNASSGWLYPFCAAAAHTGARRGELMRARVDDFDFANRVVVLRENKRSRTAETFRSVEMTPFLERVAREYFASAHPGGAFAFAEGPGLPLAREESSRGLCDD